MTTPLDLEAISAEFLNQCGSCSYTMLALIRELEQTRTDRDEAVHELRRQAETIEGMRRHLRALEPGALNTGGGR